MCNLSFRRKLPLHQGSMDDGNSSSSSSIAAAGGEWDTSQVNNVVAEMLNGFGGIPNSCLFCVFGVGSCSNASSTSCNASSTLCSASSHLAMQAPHLVVQGSRDPHLAMQALHFVNAQHPYLGMRDLRAFNSAADFDDDDDDVHGWGLRKKKIKKMTKIFSEGVLLPIWEPHSR